VAPKPLASGTL
jgi:hypothetical protein